MDVLFLALCPEHVSLRSFPPISRLPSTVASTGTTRLRSRLHRYYAAVRLLTCSPAPIGGRGPKPNTCDLDHVRSPRFRRVPSARDVALDPGGTAPSRIARAYILPSMYSTISAFRDITSFVAHSHTPRSCCVRFAPAVAGDYATLATRRALPLTSTGLSPAGARQLPWRTEYMFSELAQIADNALERDQIGAQCFGLVPTVEDGKVDFVSARRQ